MLKWERLSENALCCRGVTENLLGEFARQMSSLLVAGDVLALIGELGAGKTRFVKGLAEALNVPPGEVSSPTFTLIQEYEGSLRIRHCDTYRLRQPEEFADLGLDELFAPDGIALVEWADRVEIDLPQDRLEIRITIETALERTIAVKSYGDRSLQVLLQLQNLASEPFDLN